MTKSDLLKEIKEIRSGILEIHYRKKIDIKNLNFQVKSVINYLESYVNANPAREDCNMKKLLTGISELKQSASRLQKAETKLKDDKKVHFDESKNTSINTIDELLLSL